MQKDLKQLISRTRIYYESIGRVWCKALNTYVYFTSEGRLHLIYKGNRKKRTTKEQLYKLNLFPLVVPVLKESTELQTWRFKQTNDIQYYAVVGRVGKNSIKVRVIIKRTGEGHFNYHSVMIDDKK